VTESASRDGTTKKWLFQLDGGVRIETVLMHYEDRSTVCVSTQAGCAMGCGFCATGQAGFDRHLTTGEIVEQVIRAARAAAPRRVDNVVFMGMGEPFANYDAVWAAVERLHGPMGISARHLTLSTVGIIPGIRRLAGEGLPVNLAVSLHAANDALRDELVPINRRYPLADLMEACADYLEAKGRRLTFEWALIDGVNDRPSDAEELAALANLLGAHVNLIPLNPTPGYPTRGTPPQRVVAFRDALRSRGVNATVRQNRGTDIDAACGQLRAASVDIAPTNRENEHADDRRRAL
jgi:23S rRNA (adenine2503-C2)-methyltransferase